VALSWVMEMKQNKGEFRKEIELFAKRNL